MTATASLTQGDAVKVTVASSRPAIVAAWSARLAAVPRLRVTRAVAADAPALRAVLHSTDPHVVLLDVAALEWLGADALHQLRGERSKPCVLIVCDSAGPQLVEIVLRNRFDGYLVSDSRADLCAKAIQSVRRGELWLPRTAVTAALFARLDEQVHEAERDKRPKVAQRQPLTAREQQVADRVRSGCSNSEIARALGIKRDTVKKHLRSTFGKLGVQSRGELAAVDERANLAAL